MNIVKPYLIQRAKVRDNPRHNKKISENIETDYMGSAEFEFGALPKSLRRIYKDLELYHIIQVKEIKNDKNQPLIVWLKFPFEILPEYVEYLKLLRQGKLHVKECTNFDLPSVNNTTFAKETNFWWDIDNDVMFSFKPAIMKVLADCVRTSIAYMDEQQTTT